ncbi:MAG: glycosyltransferase family 2 protein [Patescibacteria group bacterium]
MSFPKVTIQIVTYNSVKYLPDCLRSIFNQTYRDFQVLAVDNNSQDNTVEFLKRNYPLVTVFQNKKNLGFARANNQGLKLLNSPYVVFCNADVILEPDWLEKIMARAADENYRRVGSFGGKLLKVKILDKELNEIEKLNVADSCGLKLYKNHQVVERGIGEPSEKFMSDELVFGQSAALALFRREALEECLIKTKSVPEGEYFDEDFFFYKEDVDLSWRLQLMGWGSLFVAGAVAYHFRSFGATAGGFKMVFKNRRKQSRFARYYSHRNHLLVLIKNEFFGNLLKYFFPICWYELKKKIYLLFFEPYNLKSFFSVISLLPRMITKRKVIFKKAKIKAVDIRKWIN